MKTDQKISIEVNTIVCNEHDAESVWWIASVTMTIYKDKNFCCCSYFQPPLLFRLTSQPILPAEPKFTYHGKLKVWNLGLNSDITWFGIENYMVRITKRYAPTPT